GASAPSGRRGPVCPRPEHRGRPPRHRAAERRPPRGQRLAHRVSRAAGRPHGVPAPPSTGAPNTVRTGALSSPGIGVTFFTDFTVSKKRVGRPVFPRSRPAPHPQVLL